MNTTQKTEMDLDRFLTLEECAEWLKMSPVTLAAKSKGADATIPGVWINARVVRFHPRTVLERLASQESTISAGRTRRVRNK